MLKAAALFSVGNGFVLLAVTCFSLILAYILGPNDFGQFATLQAIVAILLPFVSLRIETRLANCSDNIKIIEVASAAYTSAFIFLFIGVLFAPIILLFFELFYLIVLIFLSVLLSVLDLRISIFSVNGKIKSVFVLRSIRQVFPILGALAFSWFVRDYKAALLGFLVGVCFCFPIFLRFERQKYKFSIGNFKRVLSKNREGIKASMVLGVLNALWLNSILPLMSFLDLSRAAGQYAIMQRMVSAPLSVIAVALNALLLKEGNALHRSRNNIFLLFVFLFFIGAIFSLALWFFLNYQSVISIPLAWKIDPYFFIAAAFFGVSSFSVGAISIVSVRLNDDWFIAWWQLLFVMVMGFVIFLYENIDGFLCSLLLGGFAYFVLIARWIYKAGVVKDL